jgi:hypothetical protein
MFFDTWKIALTIVSLSLSVKTSITRMLYVFQCGRFVCLDYDDNGAFIYIDNERVYLKLDDARPLRGIRVRDKFYTSINENKQYKVQDDDF